MMSPTGEDKYSNLSPTRFNDYLLNFDQMQLENPYVLKKRKLESTQRQMTSPKQLTIVSEAAPSQEKSNFSTINKQPPNKFSHINITRFALGSTLNSEKNVESTGGLRADCRAAPSVHPFEQETASFPHSSRPSLNLVLSLQPV